MLYVCSHAYLTTHLVCFDLLYVFLSMNFITYKYIHIYIYIAHYMLRGSVKFVDLDIANNMCLLSVNLHVLTVHLFN